jgi:hypothetical protein
MAISLVVLLAFACGGHDNKTASTGSTQAKVESTQALAATPLTPEELGALGAQIRKTPDRANDLLRQRGLDEKTFENEIRKVTEDPDASKRYAAAYKRAS